MKTANILLVDRCMLEKVKEHQRTAIGSILGYQKTYDRVSQKWQFEMM